MIDQSVPRPEVILKLTEVVSYRETTLESESFRGKVLFHNIKVSDKNLWHVLYEVMQSIKSPGWFFHLVSDDLLYIVMPNAILTSTNDEKELMNIFDYAIHHGIHPKQLDLKKLFSNPFS